jgi:hypothetical protein
LSWKPGNLRTRGFKAADQRGIFMTWLRLTALICLSLVASAATARETTVKEYGPEVTQAMIARMAPLVEAAVSQPVADLYARARDGSDNERITWSLALLAGRDTSAIADPANTPANAARFAAQEADWYTSGNALSDAPSEAETDRWLRMIQRELWQCLPCHPFFSDDDGTSYAAWVRLNDPQYWTDRVRRDDTRSMAVFIASGCISDVAVSLKLEAMAQWLVRDLVTADGQRAHLAAALLDHVTYRLRSGEDNNGCAEGRFEDLRRILRGNRPDLDGQIAAYLETRLSDPRTPVGMG